MTIHDAELMTVGPDEVVVTFRTNADDAVVTRVGEHEVTTIGPFHSANIAGLDPATTYELAVEGAPPTELLPGAVTTIAAPPGELLARVATANDVHFGEVECGILEEAPEVGPTFRSEPGAMPYPETMNRAAIAEIDALDPDAVVVKGDLTNLGTDEEYAAFLDAYTQLGERMRHVRGNHDAMIDDQMALEGAPFVVQIPGVTLAVLDTVVPGIDRGQVTSDQLGWLDQLASASSTPILVFGHHHPWDPNSNNRSETYFGINPDDSDGLIDLFGRRDAIAGYFAGHTHRNRVRRFPQARNIPIVEVACAKDYPGAWAEYRIHEGGYTQIVRRIAAPAAMAWTEKTRAMFHGLYRDYALGGLTDRCFTQPF
jgi:Icc protein